MRLDLAFRPAGKRSSLYQLVAEFGEYQLVLLPAGAFSALDHKRSLSGSRKSWPGWLDEHHFDRVGGTGTGEHSEVHHVTHGLELAFLDTAAFVGGVEKLQDHRVGP